MAEADLIEAIFGEPKEPKTWDVAKLLETLKTLTPREERVLRERFGLGGMMPMIFKDIGAGLGVGKERARQIQAKALRKLRHPSRYHRFSTEK